MRLLVLVILLALFSASNFYALAQPNDVNEAAVSQAEDSHAASDISDGSTAEPAATDRAISDRLNEIYRASGWFEELDVQAEDGVVTLDGRAAQADARAWAGDVASQAEGVSVVINRIDISVPPAIDAYSVQKELAELWREFYRLMPLIVIGLLVLFISVLAAFILSRWLVIPIARLTDSRLLLNISRKLIALIIVLIGLILFLRISGLTGIAVTIASGTGILGLIIGFAFRDIAENFLASILISVQTPFQLGDVIEVEGHTGVVHKVTSRGTILVDFDGNHIQVANATVYKSTLKNFTANPKRRLHFVIGIGYDASVTAAQDVALGVLHDHPAVLNDPEPLVLVDQLGASTINLKLYYWINGIDYSMPKVQSAMMRRVLRSMERAGISLPDEAREIIFPHGVPVSMLDRQSDARDSSTGGGSISDPPSAASVNQDETQTADLADDVNASEGDLSSEVDAIKTQAAESREVEVGGDILESE